METFCALLRLLGVEPVFHFETGCKKAIVRVIHLTSNLFIHNNVVMAIHEEKSTKGPISQTN